jgi:hypothetical protein
MMHIIDKIVDYYLTRSVKNQVIMLLMVGGFYLIAQSVLGLILEGWLKREYNIELPNFIYLGAALMALGLVILFYDIKYTLLPSMFNTVKSSRSIYLGNGKYQFVFDKRMRAAPAIAMVSPNYKINRGSIKKADENGFIVQFEKGKEIPEIQFWADAWEGLNFRQSIYLKIINLFRSKGNKIEKRKFEDSFSQRKIDAVNRA